LCFRGIVTKPVPSQESEMSDTPKTQIYDLSLSWFSTGLVAIPLKHKNILPLTFLAWYTLGNDTPNTQIYDLSLSWLGTGW
jgi:hypothetical protein